MVIVIVIVMVMMIVMMIVVVAVMVMLRGMWVERVRKCAHAASGGFSNAYN